MKHFSKIIGAFIFTLFYSATVAQINTPPASPQTTVTQIIGLTEVKIVYSRPSMRDRKIFGDLVPFGEVWRTGANASTKITFSDDVKLEGKAVPKGEYALYSIPGKDDWAIIISKNKELWGSSGYKDSDDLVRFNVKPTTMANPVETFTIAFTDITSNTANVQISWEKTSVKFKFETDVDTKVTSQINEKLIQNKSDNPNDYFQAASYYYEANKDLKQALEWIRKANELKPQFWTVHLQAKIEAKMKDYKAAVQTAEKSMAMAKEANNNDYVRLNEKAIAEWKKAK